MKTAEFTAFGWNLVRVQLANGETQTGFYREDTRIEKSESWMAWTKGERDVVEYPNALIDPFILARRGNFVAKVEFAGRVFPRGKYVLQAVGDSENWCLNSTLNGNSAPELACIWLKAGEAYTAPIGSLNLIATGTINIGTAPLAIEVTSKNAEIVAENAVAIITFSRRRNVR